ncbi:hypothetical protein SAMN06297387_11212 [Streptomyces zhaozhouensis]|uniref:Uncharacterized protein n=1 Tax=Streptomyces zhaozhouensis TaxID=1300267 RepID=A0A286DYB8_9ACTN|nr:hypothetical protein [Streptomyces zhaozhouensis]SOD63659.1 hypothetical protein SAMN06297387_11212 [Streptomyces zhaozhouensis]
MTMFYTPEGGETTLIPAEHEKVLALYRDSMPLVWEPQYVGDDMLYPLIEAEESEERAPSLPELERAVRAFITDAHTFVFEALRGDSAAGRLAAKDARGAAEAIRTAVERALGAVLAADERQGVAA